MVIVEAEDHGTLQFHAGRLIAGKPIADKPIADKPIADKPIADGPCCRSGLGAWLAAGALLAMLAAAGCRTLPPSKPLDQLTPVELQGHAIFQANCARCHNANSTRALHGPGLQALYKQPYLPSGAPANDDRVRSVIEHGRNMMPAFGNDLNEEQMQALLAYLHTL
jgi:mono/diheme cytochrome c family protein